MADARTSRTIDSPVGPLVLAASQEGLTHLLFGARASDLPHGDGSEAGALHLARAIRQLEEYFEGRRRGFELALAAEGTPFQREVWTALSAIPFGETTTYGALAEAIGRPKAVRAVGAANGRNPISIIVPCHRVIGADGTLTGFGGGLEAKDYLLRHEGWRPPEPVESAQMGLF